MTPKENYRAYREEVGKDAAKALFFFFVGIPGFIAALVGIANAPLPTTLILFAIGGAYWAIRKIASQGTSS